MQTAQANSGLVKDLAQRITDPGLADELNISEAELREWKLKYKFSPQDTWKIIRVCNQFGFSDLLLSHGVPPLPYNLATQCDLHAPPVGCELDPPNVTLIHRPTTIGGYQVDFPLGLPASIMTSNAERIDFYARRGFDILTYKTVRTEQREGHKWPNWVFLKEPSEIDPSEISGVGFQGFPGYWSEDLTNVSMANSFGVPSLDPERWQEDVRRARGVVREGHQVFIVSVIASVHESEDAIIEDFVKAALLAKNAGADIVEANYSCPNVPGDSVGEIYQAPELASRVSKALKEALGIGIRRTPLFVKIGYLRKPELRMFVELNAPHIDGIVAINTISADVVDEAEKETFTGRAKAGISGWAIKRAAQEVARNLVALREEFAKAGNRFDILGLGGVLTPQDAWDYLKIGVDAVGSCTGAFLNTNLGLEIRFDEEATKRKDNRLLFELKV